MSESTQTCNWKKRALLGSLSCVFLVFLDQLTKFFAQKSLMGKEPFVLIKGVFELQYLENQGAAFGVMQGKKTFFVIFTVIVLLLLAALYFKIPAQKRFRPVLWILVLFYAGAIGNFIDRVRLNYVVDFFYFKLINFPIFNVADIYVTVAAFFVIVLGLFYYKEEDYEAIFPAKKKVD